MSFPGSILRKFNIQPATSLLTGLVAHWKLDETSGPRADSHTGGYDLTDNNSVGYAAGKIGNAADFNGANYLTEASGLSASPGNQWACNLWFTTADPESLTRLVTHFLSGFLIEVGSGGVISTRLNGDGSFAITSIIPILADTLYQVSATWDGVALSIYLNGALADSIPSVGGFTGSIDLPTLTLGCQFGGPLGVYGPHVGLIDSVSIWSRTLTAPEVSALYNEGNGLDYEAFADVTL